jgi:hypothetical protein
MSDTFKPEKDTNRSDFAHDKGINVYDNDDAYMLNDDKDENPENIYSLDEIHENENDIDLNAARGYRNEVKELTDEETVRNKQQEYQHHHQQDEEEELGINIYLTK